MGTIVLLGIGGFFVLANLHSDSSMSASQKEKALTSLLGRAPITHPIDHTTWNTYTSSVVSFIYPSWAVVYKNDNETAKKQPIILDSFHFGVLDQHIEGVISVLSHPDFSQVSDDSGVSLRLKDTTYQKVDTKSKAEVEFFNQQSMERSSFLLKNGKIYSLVITGGDDSANEELFEKIKDSLSQ